MLCLTVYTVIMQLLRAKGLAETPQTESEVEVFCWRVGDNQDGGLRAPRGPRPGDEAESES